MDSGAVERNPAAGINEYISSGRSQRYSLGGLLIAKE
jgi:hypothetical protein